MKTMHSAFLIVLACGLTLTGLGAGCATTTGDGAAQLKAAKSPAWSLRSAKDEMIVSVSPVRRSIQIIGASAALVGAAIDAAANSGYRDEVRKALGDYDPGKIFEERLTTRIEASFSGGIAHVQPLGSTAGYNNQKDAEKARYRGLTKSGHDLVLDLKMTYGLYGAEGILITKLDGKMAGVPKGNLLWKNSFVISAEPLLANTKLIDPSKQHGPNLSSPRLTIEKNAVFQWTENGGEKLKTEFGKGVSAAVSALLCDLGLEEDAIGHFYVGEVALYRKEFEEAEQHFRKAILLDASLADAQNGLAVALGHQDKIEEAVATAKAIMETQPDFAPAHMNLAWWYVMELKDTGAARPHYEKAIALGLAPESKIEKALKKK